jgi:hypothetical protein
MPTSMDALLARLHAWRLKRLPNCALLHTMLNMSENRSTREKDEHATIRRSLLVAVVITAFCCAPLDAQSSTGFTPDPSLMAKALEAWNKLSPQEKSKYLEQFKARIAPMIRSQIEQRAAELKVAKPPKPYSASATALKYNPNAGEVAAGQHLILQSGPSRLGTKPVLIPADVPMSAGTMAITTTDMDFDGVDDTLEGQLADGFNPLYLVSNGEQGGTGFADFYDWAPQTVSAVYGSTPVRLKYRVRPLGFSNQVNTGQQYGFLQVDYLTLWNRDDGLDVGFGCEFSLSALLGLIGYTTSQMLDGSASHPLDNEWSSLLIAAPTSNYNEYNADPSQYRFYSVRAAAHEGTALDKSAYYYYSGGVAFNTHYYLWLSRQKHASYGFNPDNMPLIPSAIIASVYSAISYLYASYQIDYYTYLYYMGIASSAFYTCFVEHHGDQGAALGMFPTNVGELSAPLSGSHYIQDTKPDIGLQPKLSQSLWYIPNPFSF